MTSDRLRRLRLRWTRADAYLPFVLLVSFAVAVRLGLLAVIPSGFLHNPDSGTFMSTPLFGDSRQPAGYHAFLALLRLVAASSTLVVLVQHALGIATGLLAYAAAREAGVSRALATVAAAPVLLAGEQIYLEHAVLSESLLAVLLATGFLCALRADDRRAVRWAAAAGVVLGLAGVTRSIGLPVAAMAVVWLSLGAGHRLVRLRLGLASAAGSAIVVAGYLLVASTGSVAGLHDEDGLYSYGRIGQFADCRKFDPPTGTERLCETTRPASRPGPRGYVWGESSPANRAFPADMARSDRDRELGKFARAALLGQPLDYAGAVLTDLGRYVNSEGPARQDSGDGFIALDLSRVSEAGDRYVEELSAARYPNLRASDTALRGLLALYSGGFRLGGTLLAIALALVVAGATVPSPGRRAGMLCALVTLTLLTVPVLTLIYNQRYAVPAYTIIGVGAGIGATALASRFGVARPHGPGSRDSAAL